MNARKSWQAMLILFIPLVLILALSACDATPTPTPLPALSPVPAMPTGERPPVLAIRQELEEQLEMLYALVDAEKGRGQDLSQAQSWLTKADQALQADDLDLARENLRNAANVLRVNLP